VRATSDPVVVDLGAVGRASVTLARWYRRLVSTGEADVDELGLARAELAALPVQPGRLGRAVRLVVGGGDGASDDEIMAAVSLVCHAADRAAQALPAPVPVVSAMPQRPRRRRRSPEVVQLMLPGLDLDATPGRVR
jgi:hypothetical protein